ncbi:transcriptional regulator NrdR [soil metagenome]
MLCPQCDSPENRVVDTRVSRGGRALRRRRECLACSTRFTTYEFVEERPVQVLKQSGAVEEYDRAKLIRAVRTACAKRPVSMSAIEEIADVVEDTLGRQAGVEVPSQRIGELVMDHLKPLDRIAYVRFASVYRNFQDVGEFQEFVDEMNERGRLELQRREQSELPL